ncbi:MAG: acylphosphatase [Candidatus Bathyarchaeota archaeon]|nr:acylphosphatase [Candidatus Bathyarchaeota archaeon]
MKARAHIHVSGRVQGVFFRARTTERAVRLDVTGWICNLPDGRVEAVFEGEEEAVAAIVEFCRRGPSRAVVTDMDVKWESPTGEFKNFKMQHR